MFVESSFCPSVWLRNPHVQTLWSSKGRPLAPLPLRWEVVPLPDGDQVEVAWLDAPWTPQMKTALLVHGLTGSVSSRYIHSLMNTLGAQGWRVGCFHFRGCGRAPNLTETGYHSGQTEDVSFVLRQLSSRWPDAHLALAGFSLGANVVLRLLGQGGRPVDAAVAVSSPLVLSLCADQMERGFSRFYAYHLLGGLRAYLQRKPCSIPQEQITAARTFRAFDDLVTAPVHGFVDAEDYYTKCSSRGSLSAIETPTLVIHALDDPFFTAEVIPDPSELSPAVAFELSAFGGHVGFMQSLRSSYLDHRIPAFFDRQLEGLAATSRG